MPRDVCHEQGPARTNGTTGIVKKAFEKRLPREDSENPWQNIGDNAEILSSPVDAKACQNTTRILHSSALTSQSSYEASPVEVASKEERGTNTKDNFVNDLLAQGRYVHKARDVEGVGPRSAIIERSSCVACCNAHRQKTDVWRGQLHYCFPDLATKALHSLQSTDAADLTTDDSFERLLFGSSLLQNCRLTGGADANHQSSSTNIPEPFDLGGLAWESRNKSRSRTNYQSQIFGWVAEKDTATPRQSSQAAPEESHGFGLRNARYILGERWKN